MKNEVSYVRGAQTAVTCFTPIATGVGIPWPAWSRRPDVSTRYGCMQSGWITPWWGTSSRAG